MSATERAVIYVDSGSDLSSMTSISSVSSSASVPQSSSSSSARRAVNKLNSSLVPHHQEVVMKSSKSTSSSSSGNNFVIKIQIGEETFNPVRIDVATKNGHLHRIQHHHITTTTTTTSTTGKSILIASTEDDSSPGSNGSNSGQSSPRSESTPPPSTKPKRLGLPSLRFGSETSESDTESDISSLTDYQIARPSSSSPQAQFAHSSSANANHHNLSSSQSKSSCPAAQYVMREILGMSLDNGNKNKLMEEQSKFVQLKNNVHHSLMKSFSTQENGLKPTSGGGVAAASLVKNHNKLVKKETFSDEIKRIVQQKMNSRNAYMAEDDLAHGRRHDEELIGKFHVEPKDDEDDDSMVDVMRMTKANNKIVSFTPNSPSDDSSFSIILDQNYFHLNEIHEFNGARKAVVDGDIDTESTKRNFKKYNNHISNGNSGATLTRNFAGYKDIFAGGNKESQNQIMSDNGTIRGVKNRVRDGIATFLQTKDTKNYNEKEQGRLVVYVTSMGVVRDTFQRCQKVKQILRTLLVKFDERDCYMNRSVQDEIRERLQQPTSTSSSSTQQQQQQQQHSSHKKSKSETSSGLAGLSSPLVPQKQLLHNKMTKFQCNSNNDSCSNFNNNNHNLHHNDFNKNVNGTKPINFISLPQVFLEGQHLGDADAIEKLNETGQLRDLLRPYKSLSVLSTCDCCGGFRMLPCPICNGSKKSVHRNHFTTEFIALKCMHCDPAGLVRCDVCNSVDDYKRNS